MEPIRLWRQTSDDTRLELRRLHDELAELRAQKDYQKEGLQAELAAAQEEQQVLRAEIEEQSLSTVELPPRGPCGFLSQQSWMLEETLPGHADNELSEAWRAELLSLQRSQAEEHAAHEGHLAEAFKMNSLLEDRVQNASHEVEAMAAERRTAKQELQRVSLELETLLGARKRNGVDIQRELIQTHIELVSLQQRQEGGPRIWRDRGNPEDTKVAIGSVLEAQRSGAREAELLQDEMQCQKRALEKLGEEKQAQLRTFQEELFNWRSEMAAARVSQAKQQLQSQSSLRPSFGRVSEGGTGTRPAWAQHPPSLPPPPASRSLGCQVDLGEAGSRTHPALAEEVQEARRERDELAARMKRQEVVQEAILHTCQELEVGYKATKRQHQELRGELRRMCQERDHALRKLSVHCGSNHIEAVLKGPPAPPASAPPSLAELEAWSQLTPGPTEGTCTRQIPTPGTTPSDPWSPLGDGSVGSPAGAEDAPARSRCPANCGSADIAAGGSVECTGASTPGRGAGNGNGNGNIAEALRRLQGLTDEILGPFTGVAAATVDDKLSAED